MLLKQGVSSVSYNVINSHSVYLTCFNRYGQLILIRFFTRCDGCCRNNAFFRHSYMRLKGRKMMKKLCNSPFTALCRSASFRCGRAPNRLPGAKGKAVDTSHFLLDHSNTNHSNAIQVDLSWQHRYTSRNKITGFNTILRCLSDICLFYWDFLPKNMYLCQHNKKQSNQSNYGFIQRTGSGELTRYVRQGHQGRLCRSGV